MLILRSLFLKIREMRPGWHLALGVGIGLVLLGLAWGICILVQPPAYDIVYSSRWIPMPANQGRTATYCTLAIGNAGRKPQDDVEIHFLKSAMDHALLRPLAKDARGLEWPLAIRTRGPRTTLALGRLEPGACVTVTMILNYTALETPPAWETAFRGIEPARGKARIGDPATAADSGNHVNP